MMKNTIKNMVGALLMAGTVAAGCVPEAEPIVNEAPRINYPMTEESITAAVGQPVDFKVEIVAGDRLNCGWYVNGVLEASTASFTYVFDEPGDYEVRFEARNGSGSSSRTYKVSVSDKLEMYLSCADMLKIEDGTTIERVQDDFLKVTAVVVAGAGVKHSWTVTDADGTQVATSDQAYFDTFQLTDITTYTVAYSGSNTVGEYKLTFKVKVNDKPLNVEFSVPEGNASATEGQEFRIDATVISGASGLVHSWSVDGEEVSQEEDFVHTFSVAAKYTVTYKGVNAKNETFEAEWTVTVASSATLLDDFEGDLKPWWKTKENDPGISVVDNPDKSGINTSDKVLIDKVNGSGSTSGYFTLQTSKIAAESGIDVSRFTGIRFKVYLGNNKYYPRVHIGDTKYPPVDAPKFTGGWEMLEYRFDFHFDPYKDIVFRLLLKEDGNNIDGSDPDTNNRTVYIDDIEFLL